MSSYVRGLILLFIGRQVIRESSIHIDKLQMDQILEFLVHPDAERSSEREHICQQLLLTGRLEKVKLERLQLLGTASQKTSLALGGKCEFQLELFIFFCFRMY